VVWGDEREQFIGFAVVLCFFGGLAVHILDGGDGIDRVDVLYTTCTKKKLMKE
jgi:hypothetical protein